MNLNHCITWTEISETVLPTGAGKRLIAGNGVELVRITVPAGTKADRHSHSHEQFVQVLAGSGRLETEQGEHSFTTGAVFHFPAGTWHKARFDTDTILIETNLYPAS